MAKPRVASSSDERKPTRRALSPENREKQVIAKAIDLAEKQIDEGTASSQVLTYFLKLGSEKEKLEKERLMEENKLLRAKTKALEDQKELKEIYVDALKAMKTYSGGADPNEY